MNTYTQSIAIPKKIHALLKTDLRLSGSIESAISNIAPWFYDNKLTFFPDYTDHGISHINNVLSSIENQITDLSWGIISPADAAAIVSSVIYHDCAMHLTIDGFNYLVSAEYKAPRSEFQKAEESWLTLFGLFLHESARWDGTKLLDIFGDTNPAPHVEIPIDNLDTRSSRLIGEFIRRHHARLAHEIALVGVRASKDSKLFLLGDLKEEERDLFGFIARSHNMIIREAVDKLPSRYRRRYLDVLTPYIMALLRIADYIQIDARRAPHQILQVRHLRSPISISEWNKHNAVLDLHQYGDDPEALEVVASPESVHIFSGLKKLFQAIQSELDETWATLGEVYGLISNLRNLGLKTRRIHSNLDDVTEFERTKRPGYIPKEIKLQSAGAELLQLLVAPLYGNRPSIGIRELLQNAVDATLERKSYLEIHYPQETNYTPKVSIELLVHDDGTGSLEIIDNGIGMALDTVENYFLKAGASFRKSSWWKSEFIDDGGSSQLRRTGRFGIGALAAFLIGPKIEVTTRNFLEAEENGLHFYCGIDESLIEIRRTPAAIGTTIRINIPDKIIIDNLIDKAEEENDCDWYCLDDPEVSFIITRNSGTENYEQSIRLGNIRSNGDWNSIAAKGFTEIYWSYKSKRQKTKHNYISSDNFLCCNGFFISSEMHRGNLPDLVISPNSPVISVSHPSLYVTDPDGRLPLNLQRSGVSSSKYPFQEELELSVSRMLVSLIIQNSPDLERSNATLEQLRGLSNGIREFTERYYYNEGFPPLIYTQHGWIPLDFSIISRANLRSLVLELVDPEKTPGAWTVDKLFNTDRWYLPVFGSMTTQSSIQSFLASTIPKGDRANRFADSFGEAMIGMRLLIKSETRDTMTKPGKIPKYQWRSMEETFNHASWSILETTGCPLVDFNQIEVVDGLKKSKSIATFIFYFGELEKDIPLSPFGTAWLELNKQLFLPIARNTAR